MKFKNLILSATLAMSMLSTSIVAQADEKSKAQQFIDDYIKEHGYVDEAITGKYENPIGDPKGSDPSSLLIERTALNEVLYTATTDFDEDGDEDAIIVTLSTISFYSYDQETDSMVSLKNDETHYYFNVSQVLSYRFKVFGKHLLIIKEAISSYKENPEHVEGYYDDIPFPAVMTDSTDVRLYADVDLYYYEEGQLMQASFYESMGSANDEPTFWQDYSQGWDQRITGQEAVDKASAFFSEKLGMPVSISKPDLANGINSIDVGEEMVRYYLTCSEGKKDTFEREEYFIGDFVFQNAKNAKYPIGVRLFGFFDSDNKKYWYEGGLRQGVYGDKKNISDTQYGEVERGREIFDPESNAWYWLDAIYDGAAAYNKEVWMPYIYQDEVRGSTNGKWVRYNSSGAMIKGWYEVKGSDVALYPNQVGNKYYYDQITGEMYKGLHTINNQQYRFDEVTGALLN